MRLSGQTPRCYESSQVNRMSELVWNHISRQGKGVSSKQPLHPNSATHLSKWRPTAARSVLCNEDWALQGLPDTRTVADWVLHAGEAVEEEAASLGCATDLQTLSPQHWAQAWRWSWGDPRRSHILWFTSPLPRGARKDGWHSRRSGRNSKNLTKPRTQRNCRRLSGQNRACRGSGRRSNSLSKKGVTEPGSVLISKTWALENTGFIF